ncbi:MAG: OmpA family protein [Bacteroidota bacterium]|nr:OmpA family protein [Bacteroidota bacterium]
MKKLKFPIATIVLMLFFQSVGISQNIPTLLKASAFDLKASGDIYGAIEKFEKYCTKKPNDAEMAFFLAQLLEETRDYFKAANYYKKAFDLDTDKYKIAKFHEARMRKMTGAYETALKEFYTFRELGRGIDKQIRDQLEIEIEGCLQADSIINHPLKIIVNHIDTSVNKVYSEFSPWPIDDSTLLYASFRTDSFVHTNFGLPEKQFYLARKKAGIWHGGFDFPGPFNSISNITGNGCFSQDGERFYFTRCKNSVENILHCAIYQSRKTANGWTNPKKLTRDINLPTYSSTQPAIGPNPQNKSKEVLYFVSERPDGKGGKDIWYSEYDIIKNEFSDTKNAGRTINSQGDESSPFFNHKNNVLYFSSDGMAGLGGLDIFKSTGSKRNWTTPRNIGYPINSSADDLYFTVLKETREGFFVSNRTGSISYRDYNCCDDIYTYKWKEYTAMTVMGNIAAMLNNQNPKASNIQQNRKNDDILLPMALKEANLIDSVSGLINLEPDTSALYAFLDKTDPRLSWEDSLTLYHKLGTIDELIQKEDFKALKKELKKLRQLGVMLDDNEWEEYITGRKSEIAKIREIINSGEIDNQTAYVKVREKVVKLDLRKTYVSLFVLDPIDKKPVLLKNDSVWPDGKFKLEVEPGNDYILIAEAPNFLRKSFHFSTRNMQWSDSLDLDIRLDPITDKPIVLESIYFDFDSDVLNPQVKAYLDSTLYMVLYDNPEITIEISAHTDSKGADEYNRQLSQRRAESVTNYLKDKGIDATKVIAKGYGEEKPVAPNKNPDGSDNPEGRKKNRRVEFRILN